MKYLVLTLLTASILAIDPNNAYATAINLMCYEKSGDEEVRKEGFADKKRAIADYWSIPVTVDTSSGRGTVWGKERELSVEPTKLFLREFSRVERQTEHSLTIFALIITRKTLDFSYYNDYRIAAAVSSSKFKTNISIRKSKGKCVILQEEKGNKI